LSGLAVIPEPVTVAPGALPGDEADDESIFCMIRFFKNSLAEGSPRK